MAYTVVPTKPDGDGKKLTLANWNAHIKANIDYFKAVLAGTDADKISAAALAADVARANLLTNGGFEVWQRGPGPFTTHGAWTADRWQIVLAASTASITQIVSGIGSKGKSLSAVYTHVGGGYLVISQVVEWGNGQLAGKTVSASIKVKSTVAGAVSISLGDGIDSTASTQNIGTGEETLTVTKTLAVGATAFTLNVTMAVASCTVEINDAMLCISPVAVDYVPLTPAEDWARCLRYCWVPVLPAGAPLLSGEAATTTAAYFLVHFPVQMAAAPSMTATAADWTVSDLATFTVDLTALTLDKSRPDGGRLAATVASGFTAFRPCELATDATAGRVIIFEANPA